MSETSRREFLGAVLAGLSGATAVARAGTPAPASPKPGGTKGKSRVAVARRGDAVGEDLKVRPEALMALLEAGVMSAVKAPDLKSALATLFRPEDKVGIKVNCLAGRGLSTHPELVAAIVAALERAGVPRRQVIIWDRSDTDLRKAGFTIARSGEGPLCFGTNADFEPEPTSVGSVSSCFSRILTEQTTALISVPVLKDHDLAGVSGTLKNFYGAIHNPNKYHDANCSPYVAEVNSHPAIRGKLRLVVCDGLVAQCHGGPAYKPEHAWPLGALVVSTDPVALDRVVWRIIEERRKEKGLPTLKEAKRDPLWLAVAEGLGLGTADLNAIEEVTA